MTVDKMRDVVIGALGTVGAVASAGSIQGEPGGLGVEMHDGQRFFITVTDA